MSHEEIEFSFNMIMSHYFFYVPIFTIDLYLTIYYLFKRLSFIYHKFIILFNSEFLN